MNKLGLLLVAVREATHHGGTKGHLGTGVLERTCILGFGFGWVVGRGPKEWGCALDWVLSESRVYVELSRGRVHAACFNGAHAVGRQTPDLLLLVLPPV